MDHNDKRETADCNSGNFALVRCVAVCRVIGAARDQYLYAKRDRVSRVVSLRASSTLDLSWDEPAEIIHQYKHDAKRTCGPYMRQPCSVIWEHEFKLDHCIRAIATHERKNLQNSFRHLIEAHHGAPSHP